jgi:hypothetical protein
LPGKSNFIADAESRNPLSTGDWKISTSAFEKIQQLWNVKVDLFASSWNTQLPIFVSWFSQPGAWMTDAFTLNWRFIRSFAFPPFQPHLAVSFEADPGPSNNGNGHTALAHAVMVPDPVGTVDRHTPLVPSGTGFVDILAGGIPSTNGQSFHPVNHLEAIGSCLDSQGFPPEVVQLLLPQRDKTPTLHTSRRGMVGVIGAKQRQPIPCLVV